MARFRRSTLWEEHFTFQFTNSTSTLMLDTWRIGPDDCCVWVSVFSPKPTKQKAVCFVVFTRLEQTQTRLKHWFEQRALCASIRCRHFILSLYSIAWFTNVVASLSQSCEHQKKMQFAWVACWTLTWASLKIHTLLNDTFPSNLIQYLYRYICIFSV